ncbi:MAG: tetratricopeptide repeat protein, partial [Desulfobaccales bacterium]
MKRRCWQVMLMVTALGLMAAGPLGAQADPNLTQMQVKSYDLLEAGQLAEAQKLYEQILQQDPGNPLALNNLGAIKVKERQYQAALKYLEQALPKAKGYKIKVNQVCAVDGICLAFR